VLPAVQRDISVREQLVQVSEAPFTLPSENGRLRFGEEVQAVRYILLNHDLEALIRYPTTLERHAAAAQDALRLTAALTAAPVPRDAVSVTLQLGGGGGPVTCHFRRKRGIRDG
jgi:hypothetical protein